MWTPESLSELATGYWKSQTLLAGIETGLFDALPGNAAGACASAGVDERVGTMLLEALTAMGVVERDSTGVFTVAPSAVAYLRTDSPTSLAGALRLNAAMYLLWEKLPATVRTGKPAMPPGNHLGTDPGRTRGFVMGMHSRGLALLPVVAAAVDLAGVPSLLDVGSGPGTLGRMLAERNPGLSVTCLDLPPITEIAEQIGAKHPAAGRVRYLPRDYLREPIPGGHEAIVYCGAMHQHSPEQAQQLIQKLATALPAGGKLFVIDLLADGQRTGPVFAMLFALNMALVSPVSYTHSVAEVKGYLEEVGLAWKSTKDMGLYSVVEARKA